MCLGIPGQIVEVHDPQRKLAMIEVSGVRRVINITCIVNEAHPAEACLGDWVLMHVGFAMSIIDEAEAARTLALLTEMGELQAEFEAIRDSAAAQA
jgi:hydrogenase expression/formation protein HypC